MRLGYVKIIEKTGKTGFGHLKKRH